MRPACRLIGLALVLVLVASACGFQQRREQADFVVDTADRVRQAGSLQVVMIQTLQPIRLTDTDIEIHPLPIPIAGALDITARRTSPGFTVLDTLTERFPALELPQIPAGTLAGLSGATQNDTPGFTPAMVFDGEILYLRRLTADEGERTWAKLDLGDLPELDDPLIGFNIINPTLWVELTGGALTGSVERIGEEEADGEQLVHYEANFDREKAFRDELDDEEFQRLTERFELMGITDIVIPGEIWLDEQGLPRKIIYRAEQQVDRNNAFQLTLAFLLSDYGDQTTIALPDPDETVEVDGVLQLINEFGIEQLLESFSAQLEFPMPEAEANL